MKKILVWLVFAAFFAVLIYVIILGLWFLFNGFELEKADYIVVAIATVVVMVYGANKLRKTDGTEKAKSQITFVEKDKTLIVKERSSLNRNLLYISRYQETNLKYNPATATYTGATVGGVTTGGWDFQDAHYSIQGGAITDKFILWYRKNDKESKIIEKIELSSQLAELAQRDKALNRFMKGNTLYITKQSENKWGDLAAQTLKNTGNYSLASDIAMKDYASTLLTKSEIKPIYDFICAQGAYSI